MILPAPAVPRTAVLDVWIRTRDRLLDGIVGARGALNDGPAAGEAAAGDLAAELRLSLNKLQAAAMNEGWHGRRLCRPAPQPRLRRLPHP